MNIPEIFWKKRKNLLNLRNDIRNDYSGTFLASNKKNLINSQNDIRNEHSGNFLKETEKFVTFTK